MGIQIQIANDKAGNIADITHRGELVVASISHSTPYYTSVATANVEYQVVLGVAGKCFVITGLLVASDKTFGSATVAETVTVYEANPADITINENTIFQVDLLKNDRLVATGLDLLVNPAKSLIAIGTDSAVDITIAGYYIDV